MIIVDSTGYEIINDQMKKCLHVSVKEGQVGWDYAKIIDNIGNVHGYLFPQYVNSVVGYDVAGPFRCYFENLSLIHSANISFSCDFIVLNPELDFNDLIELYPNPFFEQIYLDNNSDSDMYVSVFSMTGAMITDRFVSRNNSILIDMKVCSSNLFLVKMVTDSRTITRLMIRE